MGDLRGLADYIRRIRPTVWNVEVCGTIAWPILIVSMLLVLGWRIHVVNQLINECRVYVQARDADWTADRVRMMHALERIEARQTR